jgi:adenosine deaminase
MDAKSSGTPKYKKLVRYLSDRPGWQSYEEDDEEFIRECPKVELHVHLDGSFDPDFLWKYLRENPEKIYCLPAQVDLPWEPGQQLQVRKLVEECDTQRKFHNLCTCRGNRSLKTMLNCFEIFLPLVRRNLDLLEQLAFDFCQRQWEQHIVYTEVRYSPFLFAESFQGVGDDDADKDGLVNAAQVFEAVTRGLARGCKAFPGVTVNQILCALTWRPDWAMPTLEMALKHRDDVVCPVVGIDIAAGEEHFDENGFPQLFAPHYEMIQRAKCEGISITMHAGEASEHATENVRRAVVQYGAKRVGHGYRIVDNDDIMQLVLKEKIHFEGKPTLVRTACCMTFLSLSIDLTSL